MVAEQAGKFDIIPSKNPAVLDTLVWDTPSLLGRLQSQTQGFWEIVRQALDSDIPLPSTAGLRLYDHSTVHAGMRSCSLLEAEDGQCALVEFTRSGSQPLLGNTLLRSVLSDGAAFWFHEASAENIHHIYKEAEPEKLPQSLPMTGRLGIGTRMSRATFPGIWQALRECSFSATTIQNSLRELNLLKNIRERNASEQLYYPGIGFVPEGHTGSTFEGLWLCGVVEGLKAGVVRPYGADADHLMVKRGINGLERIKTVLRAARYYSFFTIDVSDILDYTAFSRNSSPKTGVETFERLISTEKTRREVLTYYKTPFKIGGRSLRLAEPDLFGLVGKYWLALEALDALIPYVKSLKGDEPFDLELSIDEHPPEVQAFDCLTTELELAFILREMQRRGNTLSHIAPNLGVEKHFDYRYWDGLEGLENRTRALHQVANEAGVVIDCHSGDDLSAQTRRALKRATGGLIHFKVSPYLQELFADVLYDFDQEMFRVWWKDTYDFVRENASRGSSFAAECLSRYNSEAGAKPHPKHMLFRVFCFATVGKRDAQGNFLYRERFYSLSPEFYVEYTRRVSSYLCMLARDLFPNHNHGEDTSLYRATEGGDGSKCN